MTTTLPKAFSPEQFAELLSDAAKAEMAKPRRAFDPRDAEIGGSSVRWYVVSVFSRDAEVELAKRRFGIFVPAIEETIISRGRKRERHVPLVPGYVFVLLWETDENWSRVANTPAVDKILGWVSDKEVDKLRAQELGDQLDANTRRKAVVRVIHGVRKRRPRASRRMKRKERKSGKAGKAA
jgi:transcription antitermination factor NusG